MNQWTFQPARDHGLPLGKRLSSLQRESGLVESGLHLTWWFLVRSYLAVWHRLTIHGAEHLPQQAPFIMVANHSSHLDALALAAPLPWRLRDRIFPIAAGDVFFQSPVMSALAASLVNALPMWRKKAGAYALKQLRERLVADPCAYILFPEGTRSRTGRMTSFKTGLGMLVAQTDVPVVPCYLDGCHAALRPDARWPSRRPIQLYLGPPLFFADVANERDGWQQIAAAVEAAVKRLAPARAAL
jgi:1-acyl-sn-glycerol-3-phosphate acyltransferase